MVKDTQVNFSTSLSWRDVGRLFQRAINDPPKRLRRGFNLSLYSPSESDGPFGALNEFDFEAGVELEPRVNVPITGALLGPKGVLEIGCQDRGDGGCEGLLVGASNTAGRKGVAQLQEHVLGFFRQSGADFEFEEPSR